MFDIKNLYLTGGPHTQTSINVIMGTIATSIFIFLGVSGLIGGGIVGYLQKDKYIIKMLYGAIAGALGTIFIVIIITILSQSRIDLFPDVYFILLNGACGFIGAGLTSLYRDRK